MQNIYDAGLKKNHDTENILLIFSLGFCCFVQTAAAGK